MSPSSGQEVQRGPTTVSPRAWRAPCPNEHFSRPGRGVIEALDHDDLERANTYFKGEGLERKKKVVGLRATEREFPEYISRNDPPLGASESSDDEPGKHAADAASSGAQDWGTTGIGESCVDLGGR